MLWESLGGDLLIPATVFKFGPWSGGRREHYLGQLYCYGESSGNLAECYF